jgi:hypothetical protein
LLRIKYWPKFILHLKKPPMPWDSYLHVYIREGSFAKSFTMFRVEEDNAVNCEGVVGRIRFEKGDSVLYSGLPDVSSILLSKIDLSNSRNKESKVVKEYMERGFIKNLDSLRAIHFRARHFLGSVIYKEGGLSWGVLLVDSNDEVCPFTEEVIKKFGIYSDVITQLVS